jgi:hypothetical protein
MNQLFSAAGGLCAAGRFCVVASRQRLLLLGLIFLQSSSGEIESLDVDLNPALSLRMKTGT